MKELVFRISEDKEGDLSELLTDSGITAFYFEKTGNKTFLKVYIDNGIIPLCIESENLVSSSDIDPSSWIHTWGDSYKGEELTKDIYVLPTGVEPPGKKYRTVIEIDPYDSFGDGHHPTTRLCGELLEYFLKNYSGDVKAGELSMLDIGTGSGILSITAWVMGIRDIELFDYDPVAVEKAAKNLRLNGIDSLSPFEADIYKYSSEKKYDIITANLLSRLLEDNLCKLIGLLEEEGVLILSGISTLWTDELKSLFKKNNLEIVEHRIREDWNGFILTLGGQMSKNSSSKR